MSIFDHSAFQKNPGNKLASNATSVSKSHIIRFTFVCLALSFTVRWLLSDFAIPEFFFFISCFSKLLISLFITMCLVQLGEMLKE